MAHCYFMGDQHKKTVIEGVTTSGEKFRPSDWAERMSGSLSTFHKRRVIYSPLLCPAVKNGHKCVIIDDELKETHPALYKEIISFAKKNQLQMDQDEGPSTNSDKE